MARRRLLLPAEWGRLLGVPDDERTLIQHYTLDLDDLTLIARKRTPHRRLGVAMMLCYLRHPGRILDAHEEPPRSLAAFVASQVDARPEDFATYRSRDPSRRQDIVDLLELTGHRPFDRGLFRELTAWLLSIAQVNRDPLALATILVEELRRRRVLLPPAAVLELILHQARARAEQLLHRILLEGMPPADMSRLDALLDPHEDTGLSLLAWLRQASMSPAPRNLLAIIDRLAKVRAMDIPAALPARIPGIAFERMATEANRMTVQHLRDLSAQRRRALLAAAGIRMGTDLTDAALVMFDKLMVMLSRRAENRADEKTLRSVRDTHAHLRTLVTACRSLINAREAGADPMVALEKEVGWFRFMASVAGIESLADPGTGNARTELLSRYASIRSFLPVFLSAFRFEGGPGVASLLRAVALVRDLFATGKRSLPDKVPTGFIRRSWRPLVMPGGAIDRKAFEICVLSELRDRLRAGDVWVEGSRQFRDFESCLMPKPTFEALRADGALPLPVTGDAVTYLPTRHQALAQCLREVGRLAAAGVLQDVDLSTGELRITPLRDQTPEGAHELARAAYDALPRVKITDLLMEVDGWIGFSDCFTHQRSGRPTDDRASLLTVILADGINLGLARMADACRCVSIRQLAWVHDWHVREETYAAALARIIDAHRALPLASAWGDGTTSSSDGQFYKAGGRGAGTGDVNARHGNEPGVSFYTHVSDQYGPFHTKVIAASASEAPHVLDGLLYHQTGLAIEEHYTDTGGVTDHVFGLCHLLGFRFAPRIRDLKDRKLYLFPGDEAPSSLKPLVGGEIDLEHLAVHWSELLRLAASIRSGTVTASAMLRRLAAYPRQNGLALALRELGRVERTIFTLDWLRDPALRRRANAGLNKGEARNALARAIFFNRLGEMRDRSFENQSYRASGLNLLVAAVILWNTRYLQAALDHLVANGTDMKSDLIRHVAPLGWEHIGLTGDYVWGADPLPENGLRPLRRPISILAA